MNAYLRPTPALWYRTWRRILTSGYGGVDKARRFTRWGIEPPLRKANS